MILKEQTSKFKYIYGGGLTVVGLFSVFTGYMLGFIPLVTGLYFFKSEGIAFNFKIKTYRYITSWFGLTFGKWQKLPKIEYISVFKTEEKTRVWVSTASTVVRDTIIKINLFYNGNHRVKAYQTNSISEAFKIAKEIATILNVNILDATERKSKWL